MELVTRTADYPVRERFDAWSDLVSRAICPVEITAPDPAVYVGRMAAARYGAVSIASVISSSCVSRRTPRLISRSDPEAVQVMLVDRGVAGVAQNGTESALQSGNLAIYTTWRPYVMHAAPRHPGLIAGTTALVPRHRIPLPTNIIESLAARTIRGDTGSGSLLAGMLDGLTRQPAMPPPAAERLACALADLLAVCLGTAADRLAVLPPETVHGALFVQVKAFIRRHLADLGLTPSAVAAAHHVSTRTLHRLFESHGDTTAGFIRRSRLDRCRHDLGNPGLRDHPIQDIAARWGFRSPTHFNRRFREATGMTLGQYRRACLQDRNS